MLRNISEKLISAKTFDITLQGYKITNRKCELPKRLRPTSL